MRAPDRPDQGSTRALGSWLANHPVEIVFAALVGAAFAELLRITSDGYFLFDDWRLILEGGSFRGMLQPYNDHLSVTILAVYRALIEVFGFYYTPFRVVGLLCLVAVPVTFFWTTRRLLGPPLAAIAALSMLGFGTIELNPATLNHYLVLVGGIGCAAALHRGRRADWVLAAALALSLSAAGGGLAVAAACLIHNACMRPPLRRWLVVLGPCILWGGWWLTAARGDGSQFRPAVRPTVSEALGYSRDIAWTPFEHLGLGIPVLAVALVVGYGGYGLWQLRQGLVAAAPFLAWSTALGVWAIGLAYGRGPHGIDMRWLGQDLPILFRYQLLALGFALLAMVPRRPVRWPARFPLATDPRWLTAAAVMVLAIGCTRGATIRSDVEYTAARLEGKGRQAKGEALMLGLGPDVIADDVTMGLPFFGLRAGEVRVLLDRYGQPLRTTVATADQDLVDLGITSARPVFRRDLECRLLTEPIPWLPTSTSRLYLWSDQATWTVEVRRFSSDWIKIAEAKAGQAVALRLPGLAADDPWQVRADGACRRAR